MDDTSPTSDDERRDPMQVFAELAMVVVDAQPPEQTLRRVAQLAQQTLPGVQDVSLTVLERGHPRTMVFTGPLAVDLDERQYELGFGPCLDAAKSGQMITVDCEDEASPYRQFARVALRAGVRHIVSVGLPVSGRTIGGLNIYSTAAEPFTRPVLEQAEVFAGYAAVAAANVASYAEAVNQATHLRTAMQSRAVIEQAKGIVMARDRCTAEEAFDLLTRISQHQNIKVRDLAAGIVEAAAQ